MSLKGRRDRASPPRQVRPADREVKRPVAFISKSSMEQDGTSRRVARLSWAQKAPSETQAGGAERTAKPTGCSMFWLAHWSENLGQFGRPVEPPPSPGRMDGPKTVGLPSCPRSPARLRWSANPLVPGLSTRARSRILRDQVIPAILSPIRHGLVVASDRMRIRGPSATPSKPLIEVAHDTKGLETGQARSNSKSAARGDALLRVPLRTR